MKELPKWFTKQGGKQYTDGASVSNSFTGSAITLNANELSIYDFIIGCQVSRPNNFLKSSEIQKHDLTQRHLKCKFTQTKTLTNTSNKHVLI